MHDFVTSVNWIIAILVLRCLKQQVQYRNSKYMPKSIRGREIAYKAKLNPKIWFLAWDPQYTRQKTGLEQGPESFSSASTSWWNLTGLKTVKELMQPSPAGAGLVIWWCNCNWNGCGAGICAGTWGGLETGSECVSLLVPH